MRKIEAFARSIRGPIDIVSGPCDECDGVRKGLHQGQKLIPYLRCG